MGCSPTNAAARATRAGCSARSRTADTRSTWRAPAFVRGGLAAAIAAREPKLDILVNNAGAAWGAPFDEFPENGWDKVVDLNLKSPFFLTRALHGPLKAAASAERPAKVIHIASIDGIAVNPLETYSYAASKAGLIHLTRRMSLRLIQDHIVVRQAERFPDPDARAGEQAAQGRPEQRAERGTRRRLF